MMLGKPYLLDLFDTSGQGDFERVRPLSYPDSNVALISFAIDNPASLESVSADH
jgi:GTPase SAR1 family protein